MRAYNDDGSYYIVTETRSSIDPANLQEILDASSASPKQTALKGQAQYFTPPWFARQMTELLPNNYQCSITFDPQCGEGALLDAVAGYNSVQIGVDIDRRLLTSTDSQGIRLAANCVDVWRLLKEFFQEITFRCQVANPPFGLQWKVPGGSGVSDSMNFTWAKMRQLGGTEGCGYMIANRATIERFKAHEVPTAYLYQTFPVGVFDASVEIGVLHFHGSHNGGPEIVHHTSADQERVRRRCEEISVPDYDIGGSSVGEVLAAIKTIANLLAEEKRGEPPFNIYLDAYGYLKTQLSTRAKLERKLTVTDVERLAKINKSHPLTLTTERDTRLLMAELVSSGVYVVQPEARAAIEAALREVEQIACPIMPITDFERVAYADEMEALEAANTVQGGDRYADGGELKERGLCLTRGKRYPTSTGTYQFINRYHRMRLHLNQKAGTTYASEHDMLLTGQDRFISIVDDRGHTHRFLDRPDPGKPHDHSDELLWQLFKKPEVLTVYEKCASDVKKNLAVMEACELLGGFEYFPGQRDFYSRVAVRNYALVGAATGCHLAGTLILMADGRTKKVEQIAQHELVMGWDGRAQRVLSTCSGREQMVRIVPIKGEPFIVNMSHILTLIRTPKSAKDGKANEVIDITVRDYLKQTRTFKHIHKLFRRGVELPAQSVPLTPYFMGVYLGDGSSGGDQVEITKPDVEIRDAVEDECSLYDWQWREKGPPNNRTYIVKGGEVRRRLKSLGLLGFTSGERFIPDCYKRGNRYQRANVLAGLLDTDGHLDRCGIFDYVTQSKQLAEDVCFVARSLGLAAYLSPCEKYCQTGGGGLYYRVCVSGDIDQIPTRIPRKQAKQRKQKKDVLRTAFKVELLDEDWYHGFSLDGDGRFLLGDFTVTHNTGKTLGAITLVALKAPQRALIIAPQGTTKGGPKDEDAIEDMQASQWITELRKFAPGLQVFELFGVEDYDRILSLNGGVLPHGVYVTYYEAMFSNGARESFNPKGKFSDRNIAKLLGIPDPDPEHSVGTRHWTTGIGDEKNGIRCIVEPCLATRIGHLFDFVALDEAHKMCHLAANVTQMIVRLQPRYRYALTATPIPNLVPDIFPIMGWLCVPDWYRGGIRNAAWPYSREEAHRFGSTFLSQERDLTQEEINRAHDPSWRGKCEKASPIISAPARLLKLIKPTMAYISKEACNPNKPKVTVHDVRVQMGAQQAKLYGHYMNRANVPYDNPMVAAAVQVAILRDLCASPAASDWNRIPALVVRSNFNSKTAAILSLVRDILSRKEQVLIVCARVKQSDYLQRKLAEAGVPVARIDSSLPPQRHTEQANLFKSGVCPVMLMGIKCAQAHSFDQCTNEIVGSLEYTWGAYDQAGGRIDRVTSRQPMNIYCVLCKNSIEEIMFDIVATKGDAATICLQGRRVPRNYIPADLGDVLAKNFKEFKVTGQQPDELTVEAQWPELCKAIRAAVAQHPCQLARKGT
jgi:hypothetical protein